MTCNVVLSASSHLLLSLSAADKNCTRQAGGWTGAVADETHCWRFWFFQFYAVFYSYCRVYRVLACSRDFDFRQNKKCKLTSVSCDIVRISSENCKLVAYVGMWFWKVLANSLYPLPCFLCFFWHSEWILLLFALISCWTECTIVFLAFLVMRQLVWKDSSRSVKSAESCAIFNFFCVRWRQIQSFRKLEAQVDAYYYPLRTFEEKFDFFYYLLSFLHIIQTGVLLWMLRVQVQADW